MIISEKVELRINSSNIKKFKGKVGDIITISPFDLSRGSGVKIQVKCDVCNSERSIKWNSYIKNYSNGDWLCRSCCTKKNLQKKYGVDNVFQLDSVKKKSRDTVFEKYGVDNISQLEDTKIKVRKTNLERYGNEKYILSDDFKLKYDEKMLEYGVNNISQLDYIKDIKNDKWNDKSDFDRELINDNRKSTNMDKYGYECGFNDDNILDKISKTNMTKYGFVVASKSESVREKISNSNKETYNEKTFKNIKNLISIDNDFFELKCDICNDNYKITKVLFYKRRENDNILCTKCNIVSKNISPKELEVLIYIKSLYSGTIISNDREVLGGKELDIYLPDIKIAIEFNGVYWHCELFKDKYYHYMKYKKCRNNGIFLFSIYEDDWMYRKNIIKSMIKNRLSLISNKIYSRKTIIKEVVDNVVVKDFLQTNHLQGYVSSSVKLGLYYNDELVCLMTFKKYSDHYELNRFCSKLNLIVIGGFSKLYKSFIKYYSDKVITFSNNDYSDGSLYENMGFVKDFDIRPDYSYIIGGSRVHKFNYRKDRLVKIFDNIDISESEHSIMISNDIYRIYDSGKVRWSNVV